MCLIGFAINISEAPIGVKYFGTFFCVSGSYAAFPGIVAWYVFRRTSYWLYLAYFFTLCSIRRLGNNLAGQYKRGVGMALHIGIGNFAGGGIVLVPDWV